MAESIIRRDVIYDRNRPLEKVFQNATSRILDFLILNQNFDYSATEISKITQIPLRTVQRVLPLLVEKELVKESGKIGNTRMYIIHSKSRLAELLGQFISATINIHIENAQKQNRMTKKTMIR
jgi:predicted AAA+ superfamily ATPase